SFSNLQVLGSYSGVGKSSKYTWDLSDCPPRHSALATSRALDAIFRQMEDNREVILAKFRQGSHEVAETKVPKPGVAPQLQIPASDVDQLPSARALLKKNSYAVVVGIEQYREKLPRADFAVHDATL